MAELPWLHAAAHAPPLPPQLHHAHASVWLEAANLSRTRVRSRKRRGAGGRPAVGRSTHPGARMKEPSPMALATKHQQNTGVGLKSDDHRAPLIHVQGGRRADRRELEAQVGRRTLRRTKPLPAALRLRSLACATPKQRKMPSPKPARARSTATSSNLSSPRRGASAVAVAKADGSCE